MGLLYDREFSTRSQQRPSLIFCDRARGSHLPPREQDTPSARDCKFFLILAASIGPNRAIPHVIFETPSHMGDFPSCPSRVPSSANPSMKLTWSTRSGVILSSFFGGFRAKGWWALCPNYRMAEGRGSSPPLRERRFRGCPGAYLEASGK